MKIKNYKKLSLLFILLPIILLCDTPGSPRWKTVSFGILGSSGSATFHTDKIFFGIEAKDLSLEGTLWDEELEWSEITGDYILQDVKKSISISTWLLTPRLGKRVKFKSSNNISTYGDFEGYMTLPFIRINIDSDDDDISASDISKAENIIEDILDFMGFKFSYGITYKINTQLSLSASVGYDHIIADFEEGDIELESNMGSTFTKFEINFTF